ncbi:MAG TPA: heterodisulfide reductase-related iron-sulfur binding cluster [Stellaceae bacterium]|jgi:glycerol-3-phosphate dehydrogenase subunit C|nr:heterodisulfide reductase-related iron-sulfur binding cluster [Stellaceae bacterium]
MREGSLEAPTRHVIEWQDPDFTDPEKLDAEMRRQFDVCHTCRRCFNLCDSFPRLFDLIDNSASGELDTVPSDKLGAVVDACTLCDMCFMTKCPYVPPHPFNIDFPHLMLRARAADLKRGKSDFTAKQLSETDRNGKLAGAVAPLANWGSDVKNHLTRPAMEAVTGIDRRAYLPKFHGKTFAMRAKARKPARDATAPAKDRKVAIFATCFVNYNNPRIGEALMAVLAKNGVETEVVYPGCCGMPFLERGDLARVAETAKKTAAQFAPWLDKGYDVVAAVPSCALMLKFEWPLIVPDDPAVKRLAQATFDASEYLVDIAKKEGLAPGLEPLPGGVTVHLACHARAQNVGAKAAELLRLVPNADVAVIERCSGHGGSWGVLKANFDTALKVGAPVARQAVKNDKMFVASECPLAAAHILQGMERTDAAKTPAESFHPIELFARAYGVLP